ncbi:hypothetical protein BGY98DRAFT_1035016 [Russula aff. rugulosa BPL654]|nr:hypothetical protein BGY98DRAFT_1035016 [Russula aff. rugulosa BPL654]
MLQPSLSGDACISVICTLNLDININAVAELTNTLLFVQRWNLVKRESVLMSRKVRKRNGMRAWISYQLIAIKRH